MNSNTARAYDNYTATTKAVASDRHIEIRVFASITARMAEVDITIPGGFAKLAEALQENSKLWRIIARDVAHPDNALPQNLRESILSLADFTLKHSAKVLSGSEEVDVLIDINKSMIAGLQGRLPSVENVNAP